MIKKRLSKIALEFNVGISTIIEFLAKKGISLESNPNTKISDDVYELLLNEFNSDFKVKKESENLSIRKKREKRESISIDDVENTNEEEAQDADEDSITEEVTIPAKDPAPVKEEKDKKAPLVTGEKTIAKIPVTEEKSTTTEKEILLPVSDKKIPVEEPKIITEEKQDSPPNVESIKQDKSNKEVGTDQKVKSTQDVKVIGKIDLDSINLKTRPGKKADKPKEQPKEEAIVKEEIIEPIPSEVTEEEIKDGFIVKQLDPTLKKIEEKQEKEDEFFIKTEVEKLTGPVVVGKIDLPVKDDKLSLSELKDDLYRKKKKKRKRIKKDKKVVQFIKGDQKNVPATGDKAKSKDVKLQKKKKYQKHEVSEEEVQQQIKDTLARLTDRTKSRTVKYRKEKRDALSIKNLEEAEKIEREKNILKVTEFVSVNELANLMNVTVNEVIAACMNLGLFVSINQRLDADTMSIVADEFGFKLEIVSPELQEVIQDEEDNEENKISRPPIVTIMGHVDHGKTSLLDYIRKTNVIAGEAGGITQHIGAYHVTLEDGRQITFLDTPGHEAFTAMRARGAKVTDIAVIVVSADDNVMPQTVEAINHAQAASVPIVFAINKIDKPGANPDKIKESLAKMNYLVEEWGGKYQSQDISAKFGKNVNELMEKVLLEAEMLELKANPNRKASGTVIESALDKGRGYVATVLVQNGTLQIGDVVLVGSYFGHVKAMYNERNQKIKETGPATPVLLLGLNGAPQAGEKFKVMQNDKDAREIANKREQLQREQDIRTHKHITLDEIGRRIKVGNFKELNIVLKGDVDGSIEALSDSLIKLSNQEIQINIIHKAVGQISESDVMLATASNAIIIGFQVRPSTSARKIAEKEQIDIRLYSIIYNAINEIKDAMTGMLSPEIKEEITATIDVKEVFKITKVGNVAGCIVTDGKATRSGKIRIIRDGIVGYTGAIESLKRFKDEVREVLNGQDCGIKIKDYNDIKVGDILECFHEIEVKKVLSS